MKLFAKVLCCFFLFVQVVWGVEIDQHFQFSEFEGEIVYLESTEQNPLSLQEVLNYKSQWNKPDKYPPNFGFSQYGYWFRTKVSNLSSADVVAVLSVKYPLIDQLEIYQVLNGEVVKESFFGDTEPFESRELNSRIFASEIQFAANQTSYLYFYLKTSSSSQLPVSLWSKDDFYQDEIILTLGIGIYFGFLFIMTVYNLFVFFTTRDSTYLLYVAYVSVFSIFQLSMTGFGFQYLWPESPGWNDISVPFSVLGSNFLAIIFALQFFELKKGYPVLYRIGIADAVCCGILLVFCFYLEYALLIQFGAIFTIVNATVMVFTSFYLLKSGLTHARYYLLGWVAFMSGCVVLSLALLGVLPLTFFTEHSAKIGSVFEVLFLSFALADRMNSANKEKAKVKVEVTEMRMKLIQENLEQKEKAIAAEAVAQAKDEFLSTMSHEIRTPMNGVVGVLQLLHSTELTPQQKEYLDIMEGSSQTLLSVINDILDFSKIQSGNMPIESIVFDLRKLLNDLNKLYSATTEVNKNLSFFLQISSDVPTYVKGDPTRIRQVLTNLLNNAVKFTQNGSIKLIAKPGESEGDLLFGVEDTGLGISKENISRLFNRYSQAGSDVSRKFGGTGLGLSICHSLVSLMSGDIFVQSEEGRGTTFWVVVNLPAANEFQAHAEDDGCEMDFSAVNILLADDNPVNRFVAEKMMHKVGVGHITLVENGEQAVEAFKQNRYDLVFMDCIMPELNGYEATRKIRESELTQGLSPVPVIALTAGVSEKEKEKSIDAGMNDHLTKPLVLKELEKTLKAHCVH